MYKTFLPLNKVDILNSLSRLGLGNKNNFDNGWFAFFLLKTLLIICCLLVVASIGYAQEKKDTTRGPIQFSGNINFTTNGISPILAFSLGKLAVLVNLSLKKNRFSYAPEMAFSV